MRRTGVVVAGFVVLIILAMAWVRMIRKVQPNQPGDNEPTALTDVRGSERVTAGGTNREGEPGLGQDTLYEQQVAARAAQTGQQGSVAHSQDVLAQRVRELEDRVSEYTQVIAELPRGLSASDRVTLEATKVDVEIRQTVRRAIESLGSFEEARRYLDAVVTWQAIPGEIGVDLHGELPNVVKGMEVTSLTNGSTDAKPIVLFKEAHSDSGIQLILCQDVLVARDSVDFFRLRLIPYGVIVSNEGVLVASVNPSFLLDSAGNVERPHWASWFPSIYVIVIDTYQAGQGVPWVALVNGPNGSGKYMTLEVKAFSEADRAWHSVTGREWTDIASWEYDAGSKTLTLEPLNESLNVQDLVTKEVQMREAR